MPKAATVLMLASVLALPGVSAQAIDLNPFSAIKGAVEAAVEDRSSADIAKDLEIKAKLTADVIGKLGKEVISINADVYEQDVMLTGAVEKAEVKAKAEELTRAVKGVKKIYNDMLVIPAIDQKKGAVEGFVDDTVIEGKINALLLDAKGVNVTNFRWRSVGGRVFLFGRALSKEELEEVQFRASRKVSNASIIQFVRIGPTSQASHSTIFCLSVASTASILIPSTCSASTVAEARQITHPVPSNLICSSWPSMILTEHVNASPHDGFSR